MRRAASLTEVGTLATSAAGAEPSGQGGFERLRVSGGSSDVAVRPNQDGVDVLIGLGFDVVDPVGPAAN